MTGAADRRRFPRVPVELRINWRDLGRPKETYTEISQDLSAGGVFVATTVGVEEGSLLDLEIAPGSGPPIRLRAEVVRVEEELARTGSKTTSRVRGMALKFLDDDTGQLERLRALMDKMEGMKSNVEPGRSRKR
ncbi:MAG: PilZ domain-containing protein [Deltaproteobacteria bacterium]|nr:PilZ domain-containing protein [Deltaproteobacteria bacterium]